MGVRQEREEWSFGPNAVGQRDMGQGGAVGLRQRAVAIGVFRVRRWSPLARVPCPHAARSAGRSALSAAHERIRQVVHQNLQLMRRTGISISNPPVGEGRGRVLLHLGPGLRQAIDVDDIYFVEAEGRRHASLDARALAAADVRPIGEIKASVEERLPATPPQHPRQPRSRAPGATPVAEARTGAPAPPAGQRRAAREPGRPRRAVGGVRRAVRGRGPGDERRRGRP